MSDYTISGRLAQYMVASREANLPSEVMLATKHRILDSLAAMVSGSRLKPGEMAIRFTASQGGTAEASVVTTRIRTTAINAAMANAMFGHADETDDFHPLTKAHPGCSVVPAALAMAEREGRSGIDLINSVALGYDLCCRFLIALGADLVRASHRSAEGTSSTMGSVGAAASLARLDETGMRYALSYAAQQVSGIWSWVRDAEHVEKAFDFSGMGARNGVTAATMVQMGFTGVRDVFDGEHNAFIALSANPDPEEMVKELGSRYFITETAIKPFSVGYPIQAPLDALRLPEDGARIVNNRSMPDVNIQYIIAVALADGTLTFADSHSYERMEDPEVCSICERIELIADPALKNPAAPRSGHVEVRLTDGKTISHFTSHAPGTKENPMNTERVNEKARHLMAPVLGSDQTERIISQINELEHLDDARKLAPLLMCDQA
jgi:2-methylcitrate dehydratase PrpD